MALLGDLPPASPTNLMLVKSVNQENDCAESSGGGLTLSTVSVGNTVDNFQDNSGEQRQCLHGLVRLGNGQGMLERPQVEPAAVSPF